jgi:glycosyltransferase involved in cell wall biosynthesis
LEALASGLPVVTTRVGAEGLGVENGKEALIADEPEKLALAAIEVVGNKELARNLGVLGRQFVKNKYLWERSADILDKIYTEVVK